MSTALIIGSGLIGKSFITRFTQAGWEVNVHDINSDVADEVEQLGATFFSDLEEAAEGVDFVQEAGPEDPEFKQEMFARLAEVTGDGVVLASSSSALLPSLIARDNPAAERVIVGHPFTPVHLMPVLEIVPGPDTSSETTQRAEKVYSELGFEPTTLRKEITGFVGNRIQKAIMWEAIYLVQEGVVTPEELDTIVRNSLGLRYAAVGPFEANRLGGGAEGISAIFEGIASAWADNMPAGEPDLDHLDELFSQVDDAYGADEESFERRETARDEKLRGFNAVISGDADEQTR